MKKILSILFLFLATLAAQASYNTYTITLTNVSSLNGSNIVVNGATRTWYNTITNSGTQIQTTNVIGYAASNLFNHIAGAGFSGVSLARSSTNGITLAGLNLTVTASTGYCTISLATNTTGGGVVGVVVPFNSTYTGTNLPYVGSQLVTDIDANSTTAFSATSPTLANYVALSTVQTVTGAKNFSGANNYSNPAQVFNGGTITNSILSNCIPALTNGYATNLKLTNGVNYGLPFRSPGTGNDSEQFGTGASALNDGALAVGNGTTANGIGATSLGASASSIDGATAIGASASASGGNSSAIGNGSIAQGTGGIAIGQSAESDLEYGIAIGYLSVAGYTNSIALGAHAGTDQAFQVKLGTSLYSVSIPGYLQVDGGMSNTVFVGSATFNNSIISPRKNITGLVNGANSAVDTSTNYYIKISGPTAAYSISGFNGGVNGRSVVIQKNDSWVLTILNDSGTEPGLSATNRIYTGTGADVTVTNNPGFIRLLYDTATSHWGVESKSN